MSYKTTLRHVLEELQRQQQKRQRRDRAARQDRGRQQPAPARTAAPRPMGQRNRPARPVRTWRDRPRTPARTR